MTVIRFSKDSRFLFSGDERGYLYGYDMMHDFKRKCKKRVQEDYINDMIIIDEE